MQPAELLTEALQLLLLREELPTILITGQTVHQLQTHHPRPIPSPALLPALT